MYWVLYPFDLCVNQDREYAPYWDKQNEIIVKDIDIKNPKFSIEPIQQKHLELGKKWVDSPLKIL
ncbi:MAG: hypothetical protein ACTSW1_05685, partial [Candidatus Hodarchaeales archaeon]